MKNVNQRLKRLTETDLCQAEVADEYRKELLQLAKDAADAKTAKKNSKLFKALSDEKRVRIVKLLRVKEMCVCELMVCLDMTQPNLSHHIQILENVGIVNRTKKGKWVYCSLADRELVEKMIELNLL
ncbi:metalloregulator ArsR/SmtB family transcription factor [Candidatus Bathyarchaeota archaeon]|nr:metalloregulator ArsR/SmtB family transcription factor [Candidatus Bathyarchaeota archaeon]